MNNEPVIKLVEEVIANLRRIQVSAPPPVPDNLQIPIAMLRSVMAQLGDFNDLFPAHPVPPDLPGEPLSNDELLLNAMVGKSSPDVMVWARGYEQLQEATVEVIEVSYHLYWHLGMLPEGKTTTWAEAVMALYDAAGRNMDVLVQGVKDAYLSRQSGAVTFKGPRSVAAYVTNVKQTRDTPGGGGDKPPDIIIQEW